MAITAIGFDGTVNEASFAQLMRAASEVGYRHGVTSGYVASTGSGTRAIAVTAGIAFVSGVLVTSNATETVFLDANTGSANRTDYIVLSVNWATNTCAVAVVKGSSATAPALTQNEGSLWQMPIARVTVRPSNTSFPANQIENAKPLPRRTYRFKGSDIAAGQVNSGSTNGVLASAVSLPDPGWPYVVEILAQIRVNGDTGYAEVEVTDTQSNIASSPSSLLTPNSGLKVVTVIGVSGSRSGSMTIHLRVKPGGGVSSPITWGGIPSNHLTVLQIPA